MRCLAFRARKSIRAKFDCFGYLFVGVPGDGSPTENHVNGIRSRINSNKYFRARPTRPHCFVFPESIPARGTRENNFFFLFTFQASADLRWEWKRAVFPTTPSRRAHLTRRSPWGLRMPGECSFQTFATNTIRFNR